MKLFNKKKKVEKPVDRTSYIPRRLLQVEVTRSGMLTLFFDGAWLMFSPQDTIYIQKNLNGQLGTKKK